MKKIATTILVFLSFGHVFGQTDKNGNPVFNSISTKEEEIDNYFLIANYYTLKNNIENKHSAVFISERPSLGQIEEAALKLPSEFFLLTKESRLAVMILFQNDPTRAFMVIEMETNKQTIFPSNLIGDITENRAKEIIKEEFDANAYIRDGELNFNGKQFKIIANQEIEKAVLALIQKEKLHLKPVSQIIIPSQSDLKAYVIEQTKESGELDFFTEIKGDEYVGVQVEPGVFTTKESIAFYRWGRACFEIGVNTIEDAYEIFAEYQGKPLNEQNKEYIKSGFYKEWEK